MANNTTVAIAVLAGGAGPGAWANVTALGVPTTISYAGTAGDKIRVDYSADGVRAAEGTTLTLTTASDGQAAFTATDPEGVAVAINYVRIEVLSGNAGATATANAIGAPLSGAKTTVTIPVNNTPTPGAWTDLRGQNGPQTFLYEGFAGDFAYLQGSDTNGGGAQPYELTPPTTAASWIRTVDVLPNYARVVRSAGTTAGARCASIQVQGAGGGAPAADAWVQGGNAFGSTGLLGTIDANDLAIVSHGDTILADNGADTTVGRGSGSGTTSATLTSGDGGSYVLSDDLINVTAGASLNLSSQGDTDVTSGARVTATAATSLSLTATTDAAIAAGNDLTVTAGPSKALVLAPRAAGAGQAGLVRLQELAANGTNTIGLRAPDSVAADIDYTLPVAPTVNGQVLSSTTTGIESWTGGVIVIANNSSGQSIADGGGPVTLTGWSEIADTAGIFDAGTGVTVAPVTGKYLVCAEIEFSAIVAVAAGAEFSVQAWVNGSLVVSGVVIVETAGSNVKRQAKLCMLVPANAGEQILIRASQTSGSGACALTFATTRNQLSISLMV